MKRIFSLIAGAMMLMSFGPSDTFSKEWSLYESQNGVEVYFKVTNCDDVQNGVFKNYLTIKLVNTNDHDVEVSFAMKKWYDNEPWFNDPVSYENRRTVSLTAGASTEGVCENKNLSVFHSFNNKPEVAVLTKLELDELIVKAQ
jgi:hypothetical protein